ncbi:uncharacterized protein LOC143056491 [Mytilus galloprovincialis]|uniref:uncharacterized protein LOC143056491 n=1 Tax=Mytilus galloprovincialis TaxID=29158 RepID=UPI003F7BFC8B
MARITVILKIILLFTVQTNASSEWNLVFKIATGGSGGIYDLFTNSQTQNIDDPEARLFTSTSKHFKSVIMNNWNSVGIEQVKVLIYKNGLVKAFLIFDGIGSTSTSWFSLDKLLSSSYSDLKGADTNKIGFYFDLQGLEDTNNVNYRRFYVNAAWDTSGHCLDSGWLMVSDVLSTGDCQYETNHLSQKPFILFSPFSTQIKFGEANMDEILADSLAIFVKFQTRVCRSLPVCSHPIQLYDAKFCYDPCPEITTTGYSSSQTDTTESATTLPTTQHVPSTVQTTIPELSTDMTTLRATASAITQLLTINHKHTSKYKRTLISAPDDRYSSKVIGTTGIIVIVFVVGYIICLDCVNLYRKINVK